MCSNGVYVCVGVLCVCVCEYMVRVCMLCVCVCVCVCVHVVRVCTCAEEMRQPIFFTTLHTVDQHFFVGASEP